MTLGDSSTDCPVLVLNTSLHLDIIGSRSSLSLRSPGRVISALNKSDSLDCCASVRIYQEQGFCAMVSKVYI